MYVLLLQTNWHCNWQHKLELQETEKHHTTSEILKQSSLSFGYIDAQTLAEEYYVNTIVHINTVLTN